MFRSVIPAILAVALTGCGGGGGGGSAESSNPAIQAVRTFNIGSAAVPAAFLPSLVPEIGRAHV